MPARAEEPEGLLGRITAYDVDGLGRIKLDDGRELRFGRSGCRGFEPVVGARVSVTELGAHPMGGERAAQVRAARGFEDELDGLLDAQDRERGLVRLGDDAFADAVTDALTLGRLTVLLRLVPGEGRSAVRELMRDIVSDDLQMAFHPRPSLKVHGQLVQLAVGHAPFPREHLDLSKCPPDFDVGQGFVSFLWDDALLQPYRPALEGDGTRLDETAQRVDDFTGNAARVLAARGAACGVVLHRQGHLVRPA